MSRALRLLGVAAGAAALVAVSGSPAMADPTSTPVITSFVGVGSDTTQDVLNALATSYNGKSPAPTNKLASWDAVGTPTITPATGCTSIPRPDGSGAGVAALRNNTNGCIDFARSSSGPKSTDGDVVFVPFASDGLTYAFDSPSTYAIKNLTAAELKSIYTCTAQKWWSVRPGQGYTGNVILPRLPQANSGTRKAFLAAINTTEAEITTAKTRAGCKLVDTVQENDPAAVNGNPNVIAPFSLARFRVLGGYQSTGIELSLAYSGGFRVDRTVYNVIKDTVGNNSVPAAFAPIFASSGYLCSTAAATVIKGRGFNTIANCGVPVATPAA